MGLSVFMYHDHNSVCKIQVNGYQWGWHYDFLPYLVWICLTASEYGLSYVVPEWCCIASYIITTYAFLSASSCD